MGIKETLVIERLHGIGYALHGQLWTSLAAIEMYADAYYKGYDLRVTDATPAALAYWKNRRDSGEIKYSG